MGIRGTLVKPLEFLTGTECSSRKELALEYTPDCDTELEVDSLVRMRVTEFRGVLIHLEGLRKIVQDRRR